MMKRELVVRPRWLGAVLLVALASCNDGTADPVSPQVMVDSIASNLKVNVTILDNAPTKLDSTGAKVGDCPATAPFALCFSGKLVLTNTGSDDWTGVFAIYYSSIRKVLSTDTDQFTITHVNGDLHRIDTTTKLTRWKAGEIKEIPFKAEYWLISETDVMPRFYVTADGAQAALIKSTDVADVGTLVTPLASPEIMKRTPSDMSVFATANSRFTVNEVVADLGAAAIAGAVIPTPASIAADTGTLDLAAGLNVSADALGVDTVAAVKAHFTTLGITSVATGGVPVTVTVDPLNAAFATKPTAEAYMLQVTAAGVVIVGGDAAGAFYGLQTLAGLVPASGTQIPLTTVAYDAPRYAYRGVQIDIARNFHSLAEILKVVDQAAAYKLNSLHLHLTDDEGWRLQIPGLPELTDVGSKRCHDPSEKTCILPQLGSGPATNTTGTGSLSTADFVAILSAAKARHINVIPEFDMPGHVRAAIKAMEARAATGDKTYLLSDPADKSVYLSTQYYTDNALNPCLDSTYAFVGKVMDEVVKMYVTAGATLKTWHVGGDEVGPGAWTASPACAALYATGGDVKTVDDVHGHFIRKVNALAKAHGFGIRGWSDGLRKTVVANNTPTKVFLDIQADLAGNDASVNWWGTLFWWDNTAYQLANAGYKVILTSPDFLYLDHPYEADPKERGYYWATRYTDVRKLFSYISGNLPANSQISVDRQGFDYTAAFTPTAATPIPVIDLTVPSNVIGLEGALFSETVRSDDNVDYMVFPRLLALAERAWHRGDWEPADGILYSAPVDTDKLATDWERFANLLGHKELAKLDKANVAYRVEVPGAEIVSGTLSANVAMPGLTIQYQNADGSWVAYDAAHPPAVTATQVRAVTASGRAGRAVAVP
jgi:hexosaminidase